MPRISLAGTPRTVVDDGDSERVPATLTCNRPRTISSQHQQRERAPARCEVACPNDVVLDLRVPPPTETHVPPGHPLLLPRENGKALDRHTVTRFINKAGAAAPDWPTSTRASCDTPWPPKRSTVA